MQLILRLLPACVIRAIGRLQFRFPFLRDMINTAAQRFAGEGIIQRGAGKGLYFDARGCYPGFLAGTSEPLEQATLLKYAAPGSVVYDLGANAGYYAVIAARAVGSDGRVYAFEPTPALAERVRQNAARNHQHNLEVIEAAVANADGETAFDLVGELSAQNALVSDAEASPRGTRVRTLRLDTFCASHPTPDLILMDIEGAEIEALRGSLQMLREKRPVIMVEVHWLVDAFFDFVEQELKPLGYVATTYDGRALPEGNMRYHALLMPGSVAT